MTGTVWHNGTYNYNYGGNLTGRVTKGGTPQKMEITVRCQAYGLVGKSTILTYDDSVSHASYNSKTVTMNKSQNYSGVSLFYIINTTLDVTCEGGEGFTICVE